MYDEKILPVEEMVAWEEFTDRVEILRELEAWVKNIQRMASSSTAIIAPRRMGKSVLLDRLVNTVFFKPEYRVAPFYFKMGREKMTLRKFLLEYATTFFRQYIAYCHQDPFLFQNKAVKLADLAEYPSENDAAKLAQKMIRDFLSRYKESDHEDARNHWDAFICFPEMLASLSGTRVAVIIDEFQDMKFFVYDTSYKHFLKMDAEGFLTEGRGAINLTATYAWQSQSRKAPMLVSGSAVTMVFRTVMGGPLGGRFGFKYLKPLSVPDGAALLQTLLGLYAPGTGITPENALHASTQVGGHPYYLYCLSVSECEDRKFDSTDAVDTVIRYEIEQGNIYGFWQTHFQDNRRHINADSDEALGKKIIYHFTRYNNRPVEISEIAERLGVPKKTVEEKIERLYLADLVRRTRARYYTFSDICLMRFIKFVYEKDMEDAEEIDLGQQGLVSNLKGRFLELVVQVTMMKFNSETLDGKFFGKTGDIRVPLFQFVDTKYAKGPGTGSYQIDVYAREKRRGERIWICECKYTVKKTGVRQVRKMERSAEALRQETEAAGRPVPEIQMWMISAGGFTREALEYAGDREDIRLSDYEGINSIFRAYGGNYNIPVFRNS